MTELSHQEPIALFSTWLDEARQLEPNDPEAMALASVGADGMPSLRMVLLKEYGADGFVFYTNMESRKGVEIINHPQLALLFHWKSLRRQVRIEGVGELVSETESDEYFATRARTSRIGAWASQQSRPLDSKIALEAAVAKYSLQYALGNIPRPAYWQGVRLRPIAFEFWMDGAFRLHDRWRFTLKEDEDDTKPANQSGRKMDNALSWQITRLYP